MNGVGVVVIGRNEGERLVRCLRSVGRDARVVYVDSGSTDGSVAAATALGAEVVALDLAVPFTAARARNAGRAALGPDLEFIQFVDGDCELRGDWLARAQAALAADGGLAAVFGRRREIAPGASRYNWLCDVEWATAPGEARYFGGDVMLRAAALDQAGGYPAEMIAGEEPDLAIRLRERGWRIACLPAEMTLHDAAIIRLGQWWRRAERAGHAYAELSHRHAGSALADYPRRLRGVLAWGVGVPVAAVFVGVILGPLAGLAVLLLPILQIARLAWRERRRGMRDAATLALFLTLAKPAQAIGAGRYLLALAGRRRSRLIEYKDRP